eukprot:1742789-Prorocentrum_lima.AAC.1
MSAPALRLPWRGGFLFIRCLSKGPAANVCIPNCIPSFGVAASNAGRRVWGSNSFASLMVDVAP